MYEMCFLSVFTAGENLRFNELQLTHNGNLICTLGSSIIIIDGLVSDRLFA